MDVRRSGGPYLIVVIALFGLAQVPFLGAPFVNLEFFPAEAARMVNEGRPYEAFLWYQKGVSSPPFAFLLIVPFYAVFGVSEFSARLPTFLSALLIIPALYVLGRRFFSTPVAVAASVLLMTNPLFWAFGRFITSNDIPFTLVSLALLIALLVALDRRDARWHLLAGGLLGAALLTKFNAVAYVPATAIVLGYGLWMSHKAPRTGAVGRTLLAYAPGLLVAALYFLWVQGVTGRVVNTQISSAAVDKLPVYMSLAGPRLFYYAMWIGLFSGPLAFFAVAGIVRARGKRVVQRALLVLLPLNAAMIAAINYLTTGYGYELGELELGWIARVLSAPALWVLQFVGLLAGEAVLAGLAVWGWRRPWPNGAIALWTLTVLLVHALNRGAQRYLLYLLPCILIYLADVGLRERRGARWRLAAGAATVVFLLATLGAGVFSTFYFAREGNAAAAMAACVNEQRLADLQYEVSNSVLCHCAYRIDESLFAAPGTTPRFVAVTFGRSEDPTGALCAQDVRLLGVLFKRYAVVPYRP